MKKLKKMRKLKKRKLALATAITTLTASLSMFSNVPASAEWQSAEMVVIEVADSWVMVAYSRQWNISSRNMLCEFYTMFKSSPELAPIAEQVKYGDVLRYSGEDNTMCYTEKEGINDMNFYGEGEVEIIGSVFDASFGNFGSIAVDDQTFVQITGADGTRYVFENGSDYGEVEDFLYWEYSDSYTGFNSYDNTPEYSEELANKYSKESGRPIWVLPNEDSDVNSAEWRGDEFVVIYNDPANMDILVAAPEYPFAGDDMTCRFHIMGTNSPEFAQIAEQLKYGDVIRHSDQSLLRVNPIEGISNIAYDSDDGIVEIVGSVLDTPIGDFDAVTIGDETFMLITGRDGTKYVIESEVTYDDVNEFIWRRSTDEYHKEEHAIWVLPNEDGDVNSDNEVDSADAAVILEDIALNAVGDTGKMNASENQAADVNGDGAINAADAAIVLSYSSEVGSGMLEGVTLKAYAAQ
ncbi:MAG: dockerin type I repeat-containing protein [Oscillospiraceae bacterium]|nr:dockerin type I repeat-containing protein [Oscillospiraceae bacterium]